MYTYTCNTKTVKPKESIHIKQIDDLAHTHKEGMSRVGYACIIPKIYVPSFGELYMQELYLLTLYVLHQIYDKNMKR